MNADKNKNTDMSPAAVQELDRMEAIMPHMIPADLDGRGYASIWECPCCGNNVHLGEFTKNYEYNFCPNCGQQVL